jgi:predicted KAP-like P-loop ATPase
MHFSDQPIARPSEDFLGRKTFALALARAVDTLAPARDGFVIALLGEWGTGKTSVVRLLVRYIRHIEMSRASQKPLNGETEAKPKSIEELEEMAPVFERIEGRIADLESLNKNVPRWAKDARWKEIRRWLGSDDAADTADLYWQLKARVDANPHTLVIHFSPWLIAGRSELASALLSELARALGEKLGDEVKSAFGNVLQRLSEFTPVAGAGLDLVTGGLGGAVVRAGGDWSSKLAKRLVSGQTLDEIRSHLKKVLRQLDDRQVLVIIDDLDRLTPDEAVEMVSLVKSLGDLPNVVYLLCYDEITLDALIKTSIGVDGIRFLEKIVQYPVHLPLIEDADLTALFNAEMSKYVNVALPEEEQRRLSYVWTHVLRRYIKTPRDIRRFVNSFAVSYSGTSDFTDVVDLVTLECLRVFEPNVYNFVRNYLGELTG